MAGKRSQDKDASKPLNYHTAPPAHAVGEGGPEKNSGKEGPDTLPKDIMWRREDDD